MSKRKSNPDWEKFKKKASNSRSKKEESTPERDYITVQHLSSAVEGKWQKYTRIGPLTIVPLGVEATLDNIKKACVKHFNMTGMDCDILAGDRVPSFTDISQISIWKVLHVRFLNTASAIIDDSQCSYKRTERQTMQRSSPVKISLLHSSTKGVEASKVPASVPLSSLLKLGKVIDPKTQVSTVIIEEFDLSTKAWRTPFEVKVNLETKPFASGSFRDAFKATIISGPAEAKGKLFLFVLKKFKKDQVESLEKLFSSEEAHTRKMVQMNTLSRNLAAKMSRDAPKKFGEALQYNKLYFCKVDGEVATLEEYLDGKFTKYINNTGEIYSKSDDDIGMKCESFVHYTYHTSNKQIMVLDIQGVQCQLCDPEIASQTLKDAEDGSIFFCTGNLSEFAIKKFIIQHVCNKYCHMLKLPELDFDTSQLSPLPASPTSD